MILSWDWIESTNNILRLMYCTLFLLFFYIWCWLHDGWPLLHWIMIPELLNITEACLYITSSTYYPNEGYSSYNGTEFINDPVTGEVQKIELAAAVVATAAALGWCASWWAAYPRYPGRGITLDDPDLTALFTLVLGALMYLSYASQIIQDPSTYGSNLLYVQADYVYALNGILYSIIALRDCGFFSFGPVGGIWNFYEKFDWINQQQQSEKEEKTDSEFVIEEEPKGD